MIRHAFLNLVKAHPMQSLRPLPLSVILSTRFRLLMAAVVLLALVPPSHLPTFGRAVALSPITPPADEELRPTHRALAAEKDLFGKTSHRPRKALDNGWASMPG